jgi:hypothetical protein
LSAIDEEAREGQAFRHRFYGDERRERVRVGKKKSGGNSDVLSD